MTNTPPDDRRALLQSSLQAIDKLQEQLDSAESAAREPIAIIGLSCRFPGGATTPEAYWELLRDGRDVVTEYPEQRRAMVEAAGVDLDVLDEETTWFGGFLDEIDQFDPQFFGISPREAATMDPQQRLVLEVSWEALERAGVAPDSLNGSSTGVFVGITGNEYIQLAKLRGPDALDVYSATGGALNAVPGRVAYTLGLQGPCMAIDTACSSSLVALHQACQSLRTRESDLALAGGVNLLLLPEAFICFNRWGMMASDGRCKTFDAAADGFVRGEGCGIVVLKRLNDAMADGDEVLAVIKGSAVNQDGRSSGLTVPSGLAQQEVIRKALDNAHVDPADVQYFEAHGTGTTLGDPIEIEAMGAVLGRGRPADRGVTIGSVKTNIGHLESASGIAGVIKVVLSMQHGQIPSHLHFHEPSPQIPWPRFPVIVPTEMTTWPTSAGRRLAGVSGFGFSGTNAHVVLESPPTMSDDTTPVANRHRVLAISARSDEALRDIAEIYSSWIEEHPDLTLADVCATVNNGRSRLSHRLAVVAMSREQLVERLDAFVAADEVAGITTGRAHRPRVAFMFTGQGAQYPGMGRGLYDDEPVFHAALDRCASLMDPLLPEPLLSVIFAEPDSTLAAMLEQTCFTQPALFAVEYALAELWLSWGVVPDVMLGHSVGEIVAAAVAGVFSLEDAARLVVARGALMQALPSGGTMIAIYAPVADVESEIAGREDVTVAAINGPAHTVVSGAAESVASIAAAFDERGVRVQALVVSHAFHSPLMNPMLDEFRRVVETIEYRSPQRRVISNVTGLEIKDELATAEHWVRHVMAPVRFADGMASVEGFGVDTLVEIGPHPVLTSMGQSCISDSAAIWAPSLRRKRIDAEQILGSLGALFAAGVAPSWMSVRSDGRRRTMPSYPFQRQRHWLDPAPRGRRSGIGGHPLLGSTTQVPLLGATIHESILAVDSPTWLDHHRLSGTVVFPATAYTELVLAATDSEQCTIDSLSILEALIVPESGEIVLQTIVTEIDGIREVKVLSLGAKDQPGAEYTVHARATVRPAGSVDDSHAVDGAVDLDELLEGYPDEVDVDAYYAHLHSIGLTYGPTFQGLSRLLRRDGAAIGFVELPDEVTNSARYRLHPALFDACFHVLGVSVAALGSASADDMYVPIAIEGLKLHRPGTNAAWCVATLIDGPDLFETSEARMSYTATLALYDVDGAMIASVDQLTVRRTPRSMWQQSLGAVQEPVYELMWTATPRPTERADERDWLIVADRGGVGADVAAALGAAGARCALLDASTDDRGLGAVIADMVDKTTRIGVVYMGGLDADAAGLETTLGGALAVVQALGNHPVTDARLWLVTAGAQTIDGEPSSTSGATLWGLGRVVGNELPGLSCTCVDLDPSQGMDVTELVDEVLHADREDQVAIRSGHRSVARLTSVDSDAASPPLAPYRLLVAERGSFDALSYQPLDRRDPVAGEVEVELRSTGLNFRDVLNVLGMFPEDPGVPGLECSGVVSAVGPGVDDLAVGDSVVGIAPNAFDSHVVTRADLIVRKPGSVSFAEAATLPIAYLTAAYGLRHLADLQAGERVLIHAGAGGVGMAAIQIAQRIGAEIYTTVGSAAKRRVLEQLGVRHIYNSRTNDFAEQIQADTDGAGVDVVLNSLSDDLIGHSFSVLTPTGRFLEIGKRGVWTAERAQAERPDGHYHVYDLADLLGDEGSLHVLLQEVVDDIDAHRAEPLPLRAFPVEEIQDAFRFMAQARHIGKVVLTHRSHAPRIRDDGSYVITGGLGGLGLVVATWLVDQGARHLTLAGRSAPSSEADRVISDLRATGVTVHVLEADVSDPAGVDRMLAEATADGVPLRGVFHVAGVIDDGALAQQSWDRFEDVLAPKVTGAALLDRATRTLDLDHFVLFSSASALLGAPGQSSYAAANSAMDAIARTRRATGLPALSINWGPWAGAGMAARLEPREHQRMTSRGIDLLSTEVALDALERLLDQSAAQVAVLAADWPKMIAALGGESPAMLSDIVSASSDRRVADAPTPGSLVDALATVEPLERRELILAHVVEQIVGVLGLGSDEPIDGEQDLGELGMDSLMAVEFTNRLRTTTGLELEPTLAFDHPNANAVAVHLVDQLDRVVTLKAKLAAMSPDEVAAALAARRGAGKGDAG